MKNTKKSLIGFVSLIFIISILAQTVSAQENETKNISPLQGITATPQNTTFSESPQKSGMTQEDILIESQRNFDRSLSILNMVATLMGVLVALLALIVAVAAATGYFGIMREIKKWQELRKNTEKDASIINELRNKAENDISTWREQIGKIPQLPLYEKPSKEIVDKLDEFSRKIELLEILGASLKPEDYINRGRDFFYKEKYELARKAFEKAIELESNNYMAWFMKSSVLVMLSRYNEALEAAEKAIELKPDSHRAWITKGAALGVDEIGRTEEALKAFEKAIELKPDYFEAWFGKGLMLKTLNRTEEALKAFDKVIELKLDYADAWYNRACLYSIKGDKEKALSELKKAMELDKSYKEKAKKDKAFEKLWDDTDFKKLVE